MRARNEKAALQLLLRGGVDKGRCSGLDYFQGPAVTITKGTEKMIYLGIDSSLFGVKEGISRYIQCPDDPVENIITRLFPFVLNPVLITF